MVARGAGGLGGAVRGYASNTSGPIGFIGLGNMGGFMAKNLLKAGRTVTVFDVAPAACAQLEAAGASVASSPAEAAAGAGVVITMVPANAHVREVYTGANGVFSVMEPGTLCIDSSTVDPAVSVEMAAAATECGGSFVDAPVSGGE
jgi:3-hydroxyisobutyrate dehydrogenase